MDNNLADRVLKLISFRSKITKRYIGSCACEFSGFTGFTGSRYVHIGLFS